MKIGLFFKLYNKRIYLPEKVIFTEAAIFSSLEGDIRKVSNILTSHPGPV